MARPQNIGGERTVLAMETGGFHEFLIDPLLEEGDEDILPIGSQSARADLDRTKDTLIGAAEIKGYSITDRQHPGQEIVPLIEHGHAAGDGGHLPFFDQGDDQIPDSAPSDFAVRVHCDDDLSPRQLHPGVKRSPLAKVPLEADDPQFVPVLSLRPLHVKEGHVL